MLSGLASPPFYELFFDPLEGNGFLGEGQSYSVMAGSSALVFRRTPFDDCWQSDGRWAGNPESVELSGARFETPPASLHQITNRTVPGDLYTGVHVGTSAFERGGGNLLMFAATWSPQLFARYGQRPLLVRLEGISPVQRDGREENLKSALMDMQARLFTIFLGGAGGSVPLRNTSVQLEALFDLYRVGTILKFAQKDRDYGAHTSQSPESSEILLISRIVSRSPGRPLRVSASAIFFNPSLL